MRQNEKRRIMSLVSDIRVLRESIANDIHRGDTKNALRGVNLLAQIGHDLIELAGGARQAFPEITTAGEIAPTIPATPPVRKYEWALYDVLQVRDEKSGAWEDFATIRSANDAELARVAVDVKSFGGVPAEFRIVGSTCERLVKYEKLLKAGDPHPTIPGAYLAFDQQSSGIPERHRLRLSGLSCADINADTD